MHGITISGVVEHGRRLGRELGFPTANMMVGAEIAAQNGVYHARVEVDGITYEAMANLGHNPSVGGGERHLESHLFDFTGELYGRMVVVELLEYIREEQKFASLDELREQLTRDKAYIKTLK